MNSIDINTNLNFLGFSDIRNFLKEYSFAMKDQFSNWTLTEWSQDLGLESPTSLTMILNGQRNIGPSIETAFIKYFSFSEKNLRHFRLLIKQDKITSSDPLHDLLENEIALNTNAKPTTTLSSKQLESINHTYYFSLRQLARLLPIPKDQKYLEKVFMCEENAINFIEIFEILESQGMLLHRNGLYSAVDVVFDTPENISSESIKQIHEASGQVALQAIRKFDVAERNFQSCTLSVNRKHLPQAQALIDKFLDDFETLIDSKEGDSVYQLNVQFFPMAVINENSLDN